MAKPQYEPLFEHTLPAWVQLHLHLVTPTESRTYRRAFIAVLVGWAPLLILSIVQSALTGTNTVTSLLWEVGAHARYLLAVPLLILAESASAPHLNAVVRHFTDGDIVDPAHHRTFNDAIESTRSLLTSRAAEILILACAYLIATMTILSRQGESVPLWASPIDVLPRYSPAGWWHMIVSLPVMLILIFGWLWRLVLWTRLMWKISRLKLRLVASHPDHCAGLCFLGHSVEAFASVGLALAVIVAGRSAHAVLEGGQLPTSYLYFNAGFLFAVAVLFVAPLLVFTSPLLATWRQSTFTYDALAARLGHLFEEEWLATSTINRKTLERPDFSATADLYSVVSNVHSMRILPLDLTNLTSLAAALLFPFVPVLFLSVPVDVIWAQIKGLFL